MSDLFNSFFVIDVPHSRSSGVPSHSFTCSCSQMFLFQDKPSVASNSRGNSNMFLLKLWVYAGLMLSLPQCTYQVCTVGTPAQCLDAEFAPGTNLAGEGFDITKMERKGTFVIDMKQWRHKDKTCTICSNPYLENKKQKLPLSVVYWRPKHSCSMQVATKLHRSSESLLTSSSSSVDNNWQFNLDVDVGKRSSSMMLAGTDSKLAEYSMEKTKNDKFGFTSHSLSCEYYR